MEFTVWSWQLFFARCPSASQTNMQRCWEKSKVICMKKAISILMCLLFALTILYPAGVILTAFFGYSFKLISISAFAIGINVLSVCVAILDCIYKNTIESKPMLTLLAILTPLSLLNAVFYIFVHHQIWVIASVFSSAGCCGVSSLAPNATIDTVRISIRAHIIIFFTIFS